jgi:hypothetical protein
MSLNITHNIKITYPWNEDGECDAWAICFHHELEKQPYGRCQNSPKLIIECDNLKIRFYCEEHKNQIIDLIKKMIKL